MNIINMTAFKLFLFTTLFVFGANGKSELTIGAIFGPDENPEEIAFTSALERAGMFGSNIHFNTKTISAPRDDLYKISRAACELAGSGVAAIAGGIAAASAAAKMEIPALHMDWLPTLEQSSPEYRMSLNYYPEATSLAIALAALVEDYDWMSYTIFYEEDEGLVRLQEVLKLHGPDSWPITVRQLMPGEDNRPIFKAIEETKESHIILDCDASRVLDYLRQAEQVKLFEDYQSYILTSLDAHLLDFAELKYGQANVTCIRMFDANGVALRGAMRDWRVAGWKTQDVTTRMVLASDAASHAAKALRDLESNIALQPEELSCNETKTWEDGFRLINFMKVIKIDGITGSVEFDNEGKRTNFELEIVELSKEGFTKIGYWTKMDGVKGTRSDGEVSEKLADKFLNKTFIVTSRLGAPFLMLREPKEGEVLEGNARYEGYSMDVIAGVSSHMNDFKFEFQLVPDGKYGSYNKETKQWDGLVRQLLDRKADLAICDLTITFARRSAVDFTMPFMTLGISILFSKPVKQPPELFSFLQPLSVDVWIYMATAYLGVSLTLFLLARMSPSDWENPHPCDKSPEELENIWDIKNCCWLTVGSIMAQGCDLMPKAISTRWAAAIWWFFALIMTASYTANLAAFLTNERMDATINSAEDLATQSKIKYGALAGGSTSNFFKESNFSTYKRMWASMESARPSVFMKSNDEGVERVKKGKRLYAFLMESTSIEYVVERHCDLTQVGGQLDSKGYGIAMPPNSPYRTAVSGAVLKLQESGQLHVLKKKWWKEMHADGACQSDEKSDDAESAAELGIDNVGGVFVVLGCGCGAAAAVALLEFLWNVRDVAVEEKISQSEAFMLELKFALNFRETTKPVHKQESSSSSSSGSAKSKDRGSRAVSILQAASSFINLDKVF